MSDWERRIKAMDDEAMSSTRRSTNIVGASAAIFAAALFGGAVFLVCVTWSAGLSATGGHLFGTQWLWPGAFSELFIVSATPFGVMAFLLAVVPARRRIQAWLRSKPLKQAYSTRWWPPRST